LILRNLLSFLRQVDEDTGRKLTQQFSHTPLDVAEIAMFNALFLLVM
jgi:hypothetical protein